MASVHTTAGSHWPALRESATSLVDRPPQANAAPADSAAAIPLTARLRHIA